MERYDAVIVGGGAAGLLAGGRAAGQGMKTLLLERGGRTGKKVLITGKGRCNVANACDIPEFMKNVPRNSKFLYSALNSFSPADSMAFFESLGIPLKVERGSRVFPVSDRAADVANALESYARKNGCTVRTGVRVQQVSSLAPSGGFRVLGYRGEEYECGALLLCTGGLSYPATGSTGDGYRIAEELGHTIVPPRPALVPMTVREVDLCRALQGLSLRNVTLSVLKRGKKKPVFRELGEMLFTHYGISGPLVLSASSRVEGPESGDYTAVLDLKPGLSQEQLDARVLRDFAGFANRDFGNALDKLLPNKLIPVLVSQSGINPEKKVNQVSREERARLCGLLKGFSLHITGFRPVEEAIVTSGGVKVGEVNPKTMESKLVPGLYFAGELLDVDGFTGGFNLQIAFSTAAAAADAMAVRGQSSLCLY